ncbi:glycoside hydrolase family 13 protein [Lacticaseibacillus hulanensis]|uniref:glycoside hydrolase family 13 protein n=1 Tax=Lacticaseibacillus hulanensis TaxID=2493111 RepID=UPI000FD7B32B|nr:alpha-glucosidase [Lacticaseibacillus hulanensis]
MDKWWQNAVVYQVYPRSFQDSNNDGIGDLNGIRQRLGYIKDLGVDVIWLNPIYATPNDDNGYDISDYEAINPEFGTMADFDALLKEAHALGLKIIMDLVVNHTSDEHAWFIESRKSRVNAHRDYYIWRDPVDGHAPNDWEGGFGGSAWQLDATTGQYYLHLFSKKQPDLNWRNPALRNDVYAMMRRWLDKGVDGFRMDVINFISKTADFTGDHRPVANGPHVHEYLQEMHQRVLQDYDVMTVGETPGVKPEQALQYAGYTADELNMVFTFQHLGVDLDAKYGRWVVHPFSLVRLKQIMSDWQVALHGHAWNSLYWNNHDQPRVVSRFGDDSAKWRVQSAKMLGAVLHFMEGTPYIYQGEELGMTNPANFKSITDYRDIEILNAYQELVTDKHELTAAQMLAGIHHSGRDNARTPMQWTAAPNAGFTAAGVTPWIGLNANYRTINAAHEVGDPDSVFAFYRQMNVLRRQYPIIVHGDYELLNPEDEQVWAYRRRLDDQTLLVVANFTAATQERPVARSNGQLLLSNYDTDAGAILRGFEVKVYLL